MNIIISAKKSRSTPKTWYYLEWGKAAGQRVAAGIFTYTKPKDQVQKNHNKEAFAILETKRSQLILEQQAISTGYIPKHKFKQNFLDYYTEFVEKNKRKGKRHLQNSLNHFKTFLNKDHLPPIELTENLCMRFRQHLLDKFNGDTPANYYSSFKKVVKSAAKEGYFRINPAEDISAKSNPNKKLKENLERDEFIQLIQTPCFNHEVKEAFVFSCYTGLRWVDVKALNWQDISGDTLRTKIIQQKSAVPLEVILHPVAKAMLEKRSKRANKPSHGKVFRLPSNDGANKVLDKWCNDARIKKHITWHCARLSFSILLQDENVDAATVALLLGHTSTKYVLQTYKRHRPKDQQMVILKLPAVREDL